MLRKPTVWHAHIGARTVVLHRDLSKYVRDPPSWFLALDGVQDRGISMYKLRSPWLNHSAAT